MSRKQKTPADRTVDWTLSPVVPRSFVGTGGKIAAKGGSSWLSDKIAGRGGSIGGGKIDDKGVMTRLRAKYWCTEFGSGISSAQAYRAE